MPAEPLLRHEYRPDIDGLRAIAVLSVVAFHATPALLPGGYVGVDTFFVISGYLISNIIFSELASGSFSLGKFYIRRIHRIFPALLAVLLATLAAGAVILLSDEYHELGWHVFSGAAFIQNMSLWLESGYFDRTSELKPLLHLWSLAIEEQYYIVYPLLVMLLWRWGRSWLAKVLLLLCAVSFLLDLSLVFAKPAAAFFLAPARGWELLAGGLLAYWMKFVRVERSSLGKAVPEIQSVLGVGLLVFSVCYIHRELPFPGYWAALPVLGSLLLISAGQSSFFNCWILSHRAVVYVGLISYPLYLWHWVLLSYAQIVRGNYLVTSEQIRDYRLLKMGLVALSFLLASLTYHFLERFLRRSGSRLVTYGLLVAMMAFAALGLLIQYLMAQAQTSAEGRPCEPVEVFFSAVRKGQDWGPAYDEGYVIQSRTEEYSLLAIGAERARKTMYFGDSNMHQYAPRIRALLQDRPERGALLFLSGGPPIPGTKKDATMAAFFFMAMAADVDTVVIGALWTRYFSEDPFFAGHEEARKTTIAPERLPLVSPQGRKVALANLEMLLARLVGSGKNVYLLLNIPVGVKFNPKSFVRRSVGAGHWLDIPASVPEEEFLSKYQSLREDLVQVARRAGARVIDPLPHFLEAGAFVCILPNGQPVYTDDGNHLRASFSAERILYLDETVR